MAHPCSEGLVVLREAGHGLNSAAVCSLRAVLGAEPQGCCREREMCSFYLCSCKCTAENKGREGETPAQAAQERNESLPGVGVEMRLMAGISWGKGEERLLEEAKQETKGRILYLFN